MNFDCPVCGNVNSDEVTYNEYRFDKWVYRVRSVDPNDTLSVSFSWVDTGYDAKNEYFECVKCSIPVVPLFYHSETCME